MLVVFCYKYHSTIIILKKKLLDALPHLADIFLLEKFKLGIKVIFWN